MRQTGIDTTAPEHLLRPAATISRAVAEKGRLPARTVERLHSALAGDPVTEGLVLIFIEARYGARNLFFLPSKVAEQVLRRPTDFLRAAKQHSEPELPF